MLVVVLERLARGLMNVPGSACPQNNIVSLFLWGHSQQYHHYPQVTSHTTEGIIAACCAVVVQWAGGSVLSVPQGLLMVGIHEVVLIQWPFFCVNTGMIVIRYDQSFSDISTFLNIESVFFVFLCVWLPLETGVRI